MKLNKKHIQIIKILLESHTSIEKVSFLLNISEKTLLNYVKQINDYFSKSMSIIKQHHNLILHVEDENKFLKLFDILTKSTQNDVINKMENIFFQILNQNVITIDDLAEFNFMSKTSINNLLKEMKQIIEKYKVSIVGKPNVGLYIDGKEYDIRKLIIEYFNQQYSTTDIDNELLVQLENLKVALKLDEQSYKRLILTIKATIDRLEKGSKIDDDINIDNHVYSSKDYNNIAFIKTYLSNHFTDIDVNKEMILVVIALLGRRASILDELITSSEATVIQTIIDETIGDVYEYYGLELDDGLFTKDIRLHIKYLINRIIFNININDESINDMKERFPFAFELSKILGENITKYIQIQVSEEELSYLTIYFSIYLEKIEREVKSISKIAIITDFGLSIQKLLQNNIMKIFGSDVKIIIIEQSNFDEFAVNDFEIIISTIRLNRLFNKIIYLENVFDEQQLKLKIEQFLIYKDLKHNNVFNKSVIVDLINSEDFEHYNKKWSYKSLIENLADKLVIEEKVDSEFKQRLMIREQDKSTIDKHLGFPHTSHSGTTISIKVGLLDEGCIDYPNLKIVILVATPDEMVNETLLIRVYEEVLAISNNAYLISKLSKDTNFQAFAQLLNQEMKG
ncbi:PRD domain-containing protein [Staphylococcus sp. ACRSN]|uniref:BglG family transcription antiterminator n=1 Tax=Staphylococcus sp. ACRSN TaxID=2918214 RepID=UPI001EF38FB5|nr:PRD domain-containing protein [Staphylococcus sp. ACRSN]MCG7337819.1 PRD domain-containing protein [Staphylococcus sp. ACRSN]